MLVKSANRLSGKGRKITPVIDRQFELPKQLGMRIAEGIQTQHAQQQSWLAQTLPTGHTRLQLMALTADLSASELQHAVDGPLDSVGR